MSEITERRVVLPTAEGTLRTAERGVQAYNILHIGFIVLPTVAGLDKFFHVLVNWENYLAPQVANMLPVSAHQFMLGIGVIEMAVGLLIALKPRIGAYVVAVWMGAIIINLLIQRNYFDIALRDFGLMLGAIALGRLSEVYEKSRRTVATAKPA